MDNIFSKKLFDFSISFYFPVSFCIVFIFSANVFASDLQSAISEFNDAHYSQARALFEAAAKDEGSKNTALYYLGRIAFENGEFEHAKDYLTQSVALEPNSSDEYYWLGRTYGELAQRANLFKQASYASSIHKYFQLAVDADSKNVTALRGLFTFYILAPSIMGGSLEKAEATLKNIRTLSPVDADIKTLDYLAKKEAYDKQLAQAVLLVKTYPESAEALFSAAHVFRNQKQLEAAIVNFEAASKLPITTQNRFFVETARFHFGETCQWANVRLDDAIASMENYLSLKAGAKISDLSWPRWILAKLYFQKGEREKYQRMRMQIDSDFVKENKWMKEDIEKFDSNIKG